MTDTQHNRRIGDTKRVTYARRFYNYFKPMFTELKNGTQTFTITRLQFAEFLFQNGWFPEHWELIPTTNDASRWAFMRNTMNKIRAEMNAASHLGLHGDPPFEARAVKGPSGDIVVHNLDSMALVTYKGVADALHTYIKNKAADHQRRHEFLLQPENFDKLPPRMQFQLSGLEQTFTMVTTTATGMLDSYLKQSSQLQNEASQMLLLEEK